MKKILLAGLLLAPFLLAAQEQTQEVRNLDSIVIVATQAAKDAPVAYSRVTREDLVRTAPAQNLPFALALTPGAVVVGENGTGSGYAYLRIRGSEGARIQVNLNGIAINDAESQEVFWVNLPALSGFLENVQVQRGVGTSVNGSGAFGATVNMRTAYASPQPYAQVQTSYGSFNTWNLAAGAGTGTGFAPANPAGLSTGASANGLENGSAGKRFLPVGLGVDIRYAHNRTDGYIDRGHGNMHSLFSRVSWIRPHYALKLYYIYGEQHTGITWLGISRAQLLTNRRYNPAGEYKDADGNIRYYPNETDNYTQHHVQLNYAQYISSRLSWSNTLHMTKGDGYYENYKQKSSGDHIVRRSMDNIYVTYSSIGTWTFESVGEVLLGLNYAYYDGNHFGLRTYDVDKPDFTTAAEYYRNLGIKHDGSAFLKGSYAVPLSPGGDYILKFFADMQYRYVSLRMDGVDTDGMSLAHGAQWHFFNPKAGVTAVLAKDHQLYASAYTGSREPSRSDIKESIKAGRTAELSPEKMLDFEGGYRYTGRRLLLGVNLYAMEYKNQLVPTGKLSDTGYEIKENVPVSYRRGVEIEAGWQPLPQLRLEGNVCLSTNKIKDLTLYLDTYDNPASWNPVRPQVTEYYELTDLIYSPSVTGVAQVGYKPFAAGAGLFRNLEAVFTARFVGKQYFDNTGSAERMLPAYQLLGLTLSQPFATRRAGTFTVTVFADNLLNTQYCASAWAYRAAFRDTGTVEVTEGFFPQAGFQAVVKVAWSW
ncbi:MAG: TonB-dependent receptor [Bacteroidales bacterium]|jgi:iron complex outermembrane receptor protein|nr:TonB-dependent receptor [Bacteroidales bacterium]HPX79777.1 TonB-dependent receptor [Bacteroidales bacterium]